jgi:hypothetical protein
MIVALVVLGVVLLVVGAFIPPPGKNVANICGAVLLSHRRGAAAVLAGRDSGGGVVIIDQLAALLDTDTDRTRDVLRDGQPMVRRNHAHACWTPREEAPR